VGQKKNSFLGVSVLLVALASNLTVGTAYPIAAAEISSVRLRAKTLGIGFFVNAFMTWIFSFCVPYMFNSDQGNLGGKIGFVFLGTCVIGFGLSWREVPETKDVTYAHLDYMFQKRAPTREFKKMALAAATFAEGAQAEA
jgi:SP family general alpha glucoside:H+ symporter-like MFS transporter